MRQFALALIVLFVAPYRGGPHIQSAVRQAPKTRATPGDYDGLFREGSKIHALDAEALKERIARDPNDADARARLIAYGCQQPDDDAMEAFVLDGIAWFVAHRPSSPILERPETTTFVIWTTESFERIDRLYRAAAAREPRNAQLLASWAAFGTMHDAANALRLMKKAVALDPKNPWRHLRLAETYLAQGRIAEEPKPKDAALALGEMERSRALGGEVDRTLLLRVALWAGRPDAAERDARVATRSGASFSERHEGHTVLGQLALRKGDLAGSARHMVLSADSRTKNAPRWFVPELVLAKELLKRGRREAVVEYLQALGAHWNNGPAKAWVKDIESGRTPSWKIVLWEVR